MSAATTTEPTNVEVFASAAEKAAEMSEYLASKEALGRRHEELEDYAERQTSCGLFVSSSREA